MKEENGKPNGEESEPSKLVRVLNADAILAAEDESIDSVEVPEWGGVVYVKSMTGLQREKYLESMRQQIGQGRNATVKVILQYGSAKLAALTLCDQNGNLLFDRKPQTIEALAKKSSRALDRVVDKASKMNGLSDDDDAKHICPECGHVFTVSEEIVKNASAVQPENVSASNID